MNEKRHRHRHNRGVRGFDCHRASAGSRQVGEDLRRGRLWRFYSAGKRAGNPFEPHFRTTSHAAALDGKHIRTVEEPLRASHGKSS